MNTDILIIGAGPAGIFTAMELLRRGSRKKILLVEKGRAVEERRCPKTQTGRCMNCKPYCHITTGFSGAARFRTASSPSRPRSAATCRSSSATISRSP
mgnify:CR=1 FL=1